MAPTTAPWVCRSLAALAGFVLAALAPPAPAGAQTPPQLIFTTDHDDAAIYLDGSLACRKQCAIEQGVPGARYTVTCKLEGYLDGVASGLFPADGAVVVRCPLEPRLDDVAVLKPAEGGMPPPEPSVALTPAIVDAVVVSSPGLQRCFLDAEGRGETHAGKLWVVWWVTADGSAGNTKFETDGYDGTVIHGCILDALSKLRFPPYSSSEGKRIRFPLVPGRIRGAAGLTAGEGGTVVMAADGSAGDAGLAPAIVDATIESNEALGACLEGADGRLGSDEVWLQFHVSPSGAASGARLESPRRVDESLAACVTAAADRLWFPTSSAGIQLVMIRLGGE